MIEDIVMWILKIRCLNKYIYDKIFIREKKNYFENILLNIF